jgi:membrane fusion protein (multidrug efflux system)
MTDAPAPSMPAATPADHRHHLSRRLAVAGAALLVVGLAIVFWRTVIEHPGRIATDDAYLETDLTPISARVAGYVRAVPVADFQAVKAGELLVQIVDDDYQAQAAKAAADVASAQAALANLSAQKALLRANISAAGAAVAAAEATLDRNRREAARQRMLIADGVGSDQVQEQADTAARQSTAQVAQAQAQAQAADSQRAILAAQEQQARASLAAQLANQQLARINLAYTRIVAPFDGVVGQRLVRPGQYLATGGQVFALAPDALWVIANFRETQLTHAAVGQAALITVDTFPGRTLKGHVEAFAPASGAKFALLPPDNATGNFTKVAQRVAVKIVLDDLDGLAGKLRAGLSVTASIDTTHPGGSAG